jgi:formylglycine-generating enzyme required for sulfatase activity
LRRTIQREALWLPAQTFDLGSAPGGLVPAPERWAHPVALPEFEIDAQAVSWARFLEFAEDGGYDDPAWWDSAGWAWAQDAQRRAPRHVEQLHQGVVLQRQGRLQRAASGQAAVHITRHEAQAWCRWAGRRLPTEVEWELAACTAAARGFVWGEVLEWTGGSARGWPGHTALPGDLDPLPAAGGAVLRGACHATPGRAAHPKARRIVAADEDTLFCGFRSCAL